MRGNIQINIPITIETCQLLEDFTRINLNQGFLKYSTHPFVELVVLDDFIKDFSNVDPRTIS